MRKDADAAITLLEKWPQKIHSFNGIPTHDLYVKALENEDTLLRTHCCPWCFLGCPNWETFVVDTKCFWTTQNLCPNKCCARGQTGKHLCRQQCVLVCQGLYQCNDLPTELSKPHESGHVWVRPFMFSGRNTRLKCMNSVVVDVQQ